MKINSPLNSRGYYEAGVRVKWVGASPRADLAHSPRDSTARRLSALTPARVSGGQSVIVLSNERSLNATDHMLAVHRAAIPISPTEYQYEYEDAPTVSFI